MATSREHPYIAKLRGYLGEGRIGRREFLRTATLLGLSAGAASIMVGGGPIREAKAALPQGGTLKIGKKIFEVTNPHIFKWHSQANVCAQVCQYLARTGHDNITRPQLLERWEPSADLRTWTLHVRKGVKWRNGREFSADDAIWNLQHVLDPETGSSALGLMKGYMLEEYSDDSGNKTTRLWDANAIERIDSHTLRLNLRVPQLALPEHLYHYPIAMLDPEENGVFGVGSNGTGAFELVEYEVQKRGRFVARSDYWGDGPWLDAIEIVDLGDDPAAGIGALASNQVHGLEEASNHQLEALQQMAHLQLYSVTSAGTAVVRGKCNEPPFNDPRVRKALRLATDPGPVIEGAVRGLGTEAEHHHVCPIHPEYAELPAMGQHPEEAKRLLAEAGYAEGLEFELTARDTDWVKQAVQVMVEQWKASNIRAKINIVPLALWGGALEQGAGHLHDLGPSASRSDGAGARLSQRGSVERIGILEPGLRPDPRGGGRDLRPGRAAGTHRRAREDHAGGRPDRSAPVAERLYVHGQASTGLSHAPEHLHVRRGARSRSLT